MEDKQEILELLLAALQAMRSLSTLMRLEYHLDREIVVATFPGGTAIANVAMDSGTSMIMDVIKQIR